MTAPRGRKIERVIPRKVGYIASHDLKEPLRGIHTYTDILLEDHGEKLDEDGINKLDRLAVLTRRLESLIDSLLQYSRLGRTDLALNSSCCGIQIQQNRWNFEVRH